MITAGGILSLAFLFASVIWYYPMVVLRRVNPAPATWIVGSFAINLALVSYSAIPDRSFIENVTLYAAAVHVNLFLLLIMAVQWKSGQLKISFDRVQKLFIVAMVLALVYWAFNKEQPQVTFWTTQVLIVISYLATIGKAIQLRTAFDSIGNMGLIFFLSLAGTIPAILMESPYGIINSARAVLASGITLSVLVYFDTKNGGGRWRDELKTLKGFYGVRH